MKYLSLFLIFFMFSCGDSHYFVVEKKMDNTRIWSFEDSFNAEFEVKDNLPYDIFFELKHTDDYPFENIYLKIIDDFKGVKDTDIVNLNLANSYGIWYGDKNGDNYRYSTLLRKSFKFKKTGNYSIKIEQFTRNDSLEGVSSVLFYMDRVK